MGGLIFWSLGVGLSEEGWYRKHNAHHKYVNRLNHDPDLGIPFVFSEKQYNTQNKVFARYVRPHQDLLFFVLLPLVYFNFVVWSVRGLISTYSGRHLLEGVLMMVHFAFFLIVPFSALPVYTAIMVFVVVHIFGGAYMGLAFAPNHKGMPIRDADERTVWTDQITSTRNLWPSRTHFMFWGGLNFQIEHHLFPATSRFLYPKIQPMVKAYCVQHGISYHETTWRTAMGEIAASLREHKTS